MFSKKRQFGNIGEEIAIKKLKNKGFTILQQNYLKKWGEIDIVARGTDGKVHFIEVKSVSREMNPIRKLDVTRGTFRPEDNVTSEKIRKLERVVNSWIMENKYDGDWQIDVIALELDLERKTGKFRMIENVY